MKVLSAQFRQLSAAFSLTLLLFAGCREDGNSGFTHNDPPDDSTVGEIQFDTLCVYWPFGGHDGGYVFRDSSELASFLNSTRYGQSSRIIKEITTEPDFSKSVYIAVNGWPCDITNISAGKDTITVNYKKLYIAPPCLEEPCPQYAPPAMIAAVYSIPFTEKEIVFADVTFDIKHEGTKINYDVTANAGFAAKPFARKSGDTLIITDYWAVSGGNGYRANVTVWNDVIILEYYHDQSPVVEWAPAVETVAAFTGKLPDSLTVAFKCWTSGARDVDDWEKSQGFRNANEPLIKVIDVGSL